MLYEIMGTFLAWKSVWSFDRDVTLPNGCLGAGDANRRGYNRLLMVLIGLTQQYLKETAADYWGCR